MRRVVWNETCLMVSCNTNRMVEVYPNGNIALCASRDADGSISDIRNANHERS
jgi:hypothetical protein